MKWSGWIVFSFTALTVIAGAASEPRAASPRLLQTQIVPARFASAQQEAPAAAITPHAPVHFRLASWDIWSGSHSGYVYSPGACDCEPQCVDHLWDGYVQRPLRCNPPSMHCRGGHGGCNSCAAEPSCGCGGQALLKRAHGWHFGGKMWGGCSSCGSIAPSCAAPSCAAPTCAAPPMADGPPQPMPEVGGDAPQVEAPAPTPEKAARGNRLRGFSGPESSLQR